MFLLVPAHPGFPGQIPQSRKTVVCVCVYFTPYCAFVILQFEFIVLIFIKDGHRPKKQNKTPNEI